MTDRYEDIRKALDVIDECADGTLLMTRDRCARLRKAADTIRELLAERDALARDAARYRWLRDPCSGAERVIFYCRGDYGRGLMSSSMLDAAIDAAMQRTSGGGNG